MTTPDNQTIDEAFRRFHGQNPGVYKQLVMYARQAKRAGMRRIGISMLWERLRWYVDVEARDGKHYRLNNNYRSRYARLIEETEADLHGFFLTRLLRAQ